MKSIKLDFDGYWRKDNFRHLPIYGGIYIFYECNYHPITKVVLLKRILYIGKAKNVRSAILKHSSMKLMSNSISYGNTICVSCAAMSGTDMNRALEALVAKYLPRFNKDRRKKFNHDLTDIVCYGKYKLLKQRFQIGRKTSRIRVS